MGNSSRNRPKVTVVMPVYNTHKYVGEAIDSRCRGGRQTGRYGALVVVDLKIVVAVGIERDIVGLGEEIIEIRVNRFIQIQIIRQGDVELRLGGY